VGWRALGLCFAGSAAGCASVVARQHVGQLDPGDLVGWPRYGAWEGARVDQPVVYHVEVGPEPPHEGPEGLGQARLSAVVQRDPGRFEQFLKLLGRGGAAPPPQLPPLQLACYAVAPPEGIDVVAERVDVASRTLVYDAGQDDAVTDGGLPRAVYKSHAPRHAARRGKTFKHIRHKKRDVGGDAAPRGAEAPPELSGGGDAAPRGAEAPPERKS
jgi:hypothetical protein